MKQIFTKFFFDHKLFSPANWLTERLTCYISQHTFCRKCLSLYLQFSGDLVSLMNKSSCVEKYFTFWFCDKPASDNIGFLVSIFPHRQPCYHSTSFNIRLLDLANRDGKTPLELVLGQKLELHHPKHRSMPNGFLLFVWIYTCLCNNLKFHDICTSLERLDDITRISWNVCMKRVQTRHFIHSFFVLTIWETGFRLFKDGLTPSQSFQLKGGF